MPKYIRVDCPFPAPDGKPLQIDGEDASVAKTLLQFDMAYNGLVQALAPNDRLGVEELLRARNVTDALKDEDGWDEDKDGHRYVVVDNADVKAFQRKVEAAATVVGPANVKELRGVFEGALDKIERKKKDAK